LENKEKQLVNQDKESIEIIHRTAYYLLKDYFKNIELKKLQQHAYNSTKLLKHNAHV